MYKITQSLIASLNKNNVRYCHWKSNLLLDEALNGYDDLDLLVSKKDILKFERLIFSLGFKEGSNKNISFSSVKHFYGLDESGEILHLHVYYQIKTGPSWTKSFRFDFEEYILDNLELHHSGMPIPQKHIELVIFIFRIMLKYSKINEFILINKESQRTNKEIDYLLKNLDENRLENFLSEYFSNFTKDEIFKYIIVIKSGSKLLQFLNGNKVRNKLKRYKYLTFYEENLNNIYQFSYRFLNKLIFKQKKKLNSGTFIVVAGLDATGKTTITNELKKLLGKNFTINLIHFGKPPSTLITYPFNLMIKFLRKNSNNVNLKSSINDNKAKSLLFILRQVILSYDRYKLATKYFDKVSKGEIVICDRYKSEDYFVMDSKRLDPNVYNGIKKKLSLLENYFYNNMPTPNILFYLKVPVEVAVKRNEERIKEGKESAEFIRIRHSQNKDLTYKADFVYEIDTNREYKEVISEIKTKLWEVL